MTGRARLVLACSYAGASWDALSDDGKQAFLHAAGETLAYMSGAGIEVVDTQQPPAGYESAAAKLTDIEHRARHAEAFGDFHGLVTEVPWLAVQLREAWERAGDITAVRDLAETWCTCRTWGPWQAGLGPDQEEYIYDTAAHMILAALTTEPTPCRTCVGIGSAHPVPGYRLACPDCDGTGRTPRIPPIPLFGSCRIVDVDGEAVRVQGQGEPSPEAAAALEAVIRATRAAMESGEGFE